MEETGRTLGACTIAIILAIFMTGLTMSYTADKRLCEIRDACESTNATLGEICARLDSITITMPENAKIYYFGK